MTLKESYPIEWDELINKRVPKQDINKYLLSFVAKLIKEVKEGKREDTDIGDGWSMVINMDEKYYKLNPEVYGFLFRLGDYGIKDSLGNGTSEYGDMLHTLDEVEKELEVVLEKVAIKL